MTEARRDFLPAASILQKMRDINPHYPEWVMTAAETLQKQRQDAEARAIRPHGLQGIFNRAFLNGFASVFGGSSSLQLPAPKDAVEESWIKVGNDLRNAIQLFTVEHRLNLNLTPDEKKSLELVI